MASRHKDGPDGRLDDVQVLGSWNFTLQADTPLYWLRTGQLERYLLTCRVAMPCPCVAGIVLHGEVDGPGTDGASFWVERKPPGKRDLAATRRYIVAGDGLESKPIITRAFEDTDAEVTEDIEIMMEGYSGTIMLHGRRVQLRFRLKHGKGSVGFYNSTPSATEDGGDEPCDGPGIPGVHFGGVRITAMRRGPLEVDGRLLKRERNLERFAEEERKLEEGGAGNSGPCGNEQSPSASAMLMSQRTQLPQDGARRSRSSGSHLKASQPTKLPQALVGPRGDAGGTLGMRLDGSSSASKLRLSRSDGALRSRSTSGCRPGQQPLQWLPLATNAPAGEQALLRGVTQRHQVDIRRDCVDFIPL